MNFPQFAFNNFRRNGRAYIAYLLSSAFMVMIFFSYTLFIFHPQIKDTPMSEMASTSMGIATYIVYVFAFFFVLYSISVFLKSRNREFGILTILGAGAGQINWLIFLENMIIGAISIVTGITSGLLLSKLFLLISTKVMDIDDLPFYWPAKALTLTIVSFAALFIVISLFTLLSINKTRVLELLKGSSKPKKEPKASFLLSLFGIVLLAVGYAALHVGTLGLMSLVTAAITGIAGTYFFYSQLSVWVLRSLQRSRWLTWRGTNLLWISEMSYKIKDNTRILFLVTVMTSLACMSVGFVLALQSYSASSYRDNPFAITYSLHGSNNPEAELKEIDTQLRDAGLEFKSIPVETISSNIVNSKKGYIQIISQTHYNDFAKAMDVPPVKTLSKGEALLALSLEASKKREDINGALVDIRRVDSIQSFTFKSRTEALAMLSGSGRLLILNDEVYEEIKQEKNAQQNAALRSVIYKLANEKGLPGKHDPETRVGTSLTAWNKSLIDQGKTKNYLSSRSESYMNVKQGLALFSFIGIFIALIFSISSASFLYFKLYTELAADGITYRSLSKIGLRSREMNTSATLQIALLFFIPIVVAAVQSLVVLGSFLGYIGIPYVSGPVLTASAAFLAVQMVYFLIIRARYIKSVNNMMV